MALSSAPLGTKGLFWYDPCMNHCRMSAALPATTGVAMDVPRDWMVSQLVKALAAVM